MDTIWLVTFWLAIGINVLLFLPAAILNSDKFTDLAYSLTFILVTWYTAFAFAPLYPAQILLVGLVSVWALRLGGYLFIRIWQIGQDKRFDKVRDKPLSFFKFWLLQAVTAWILLLPTITFLVKDNLTGHGGWQSLGLIIYACGLYFETVADWQKFVFKQSKNKRDKLIMSGLWRYSRHPNYFGEICVWTGIFVYASTTLTGWEWLSVVSPLLITYLLVFVSGIPPLEKKYQARYGRDKDYLNYRDTTNMLLPWKPKNRIMD